jgi:AhpD family alkylhydroperoxidase
MNRLTQLDPAQPTGKSKQLFDEVQEKLGFVPNLFRVLGNAPAPLEGYLTFSGVVAGGSLTARVREQISLAVAESCSYCLSAHTFIGENPSILPREGRRQVGQLPSVMCRTSTPTGYPFKRLLTDKWKIQG